MRARFFTVFFIALVLEAGASAGTVTFTNATSIAIPAGGTTSGISNPYPSDIAVAGFSGGITGLTVSFFGLSHTFPDDIDVLLVSPSGGNLILMSDVGSLNDITGVNLVFDDAAASLLPDAAQIIAGTFRPTNIGAGDAFAAPAPAPSGATTLAGAFGGANPNGTWSLYIVDDLGGDIGSMSGGWALTITAPTPADIPEPSSALLLGAGLAAALALRARRR